MENANQFLAVSIDITTIKVSKSSSCSDNFIQALVVKTRRAHLRTHGASGQAVEVSFEVFNGRYNIINSSELYHV